MRVHQLLSGAGPVDAVTGQALVYRRRFTEWGWGGEDAAVHLDPRASGFVAPRELRPGEDDVLLFHYSAYAPRLTPWLARPNPKLLVYHNVTPARYLWGYQPVVAIHCAVGRSQMPEFARGVDLALGVSEYNARELARAGAPRTGVVPILLDPAALGDPGPPDPPGPPTILSVGRLTPHKRHDLVLRAFALYRRHRAPDARLVLVGEPLSEVYRRQLVGLAGALAPGAVRFESSLAPAELAGRYRSAHAFLTLSEHEGFCVPLLECFHFGVPIVARPTGGMPEVADDAALFVEDDDLAVVAELLHLAVTDASLRDELRTRARRRLEAYAPAAVESKLRAAVESVAGAAARS